MSRLWLDADDLLAIANEYIGAEVRVRDPGILYAAAARPRAVLGGVSVYPSAVEQAAALLHGIIAWAPLQSWNDGLAWVAARIHLRSRAMVLRMPAEERLRLNDHIGARMAETAPEVARRLAPHVHDWQP
jgi:death-on-curing protein